MIVSITKHRSFSKAAAELDTRQSSISQQVQHLERQLGCKMFDRSYSGIQLTVDGEAVLIYARTMLVAGTNLMKMLRRPAQRPIVRVGLNEDFGRTALPAVLGLLTRQHQEIAIQCLSAVSADLFAALDDGRLDIVVGRRPVGSTRGEPLWVTPSAWFARPGFTLTAEDPVPLVSPPQSTLQTAILEALRNAGRSWRVVFQSASLTTLEAAIQAGLGIGVFPTGLRLDQVVKIDPKQCDLPSVEPSLFVCERLADTDDAMVDLLHQFLIATAGSGFLAQP